MAQEARKAQTRRLFHPLCGADLWTLLRVMRANGAPKGHWPEAAIAVAASVARAPFSWLEHLYVRQQRSKPDATEAPVFILGHWRSGTTHLYNVMSKAPQWGFVSPFSTALPWDFLLIARWFEPLLKHALPADRYIDNIPVTSDAPQEDEIGLANMTPLSFYHALYFPKNFAKTFNAGVFFDGVSEDERAAWADTLRLYYSKLSIAQPGRRLLIKNPVYTSRVEFLREIWPEAKFIHIHRNPYEVFVSMRNFYQKLLAQFALQPYDHVDIDRIILDTYTRMMELHTQQAAAVPDNYLVELRFDQFQRHPMAELQRIYQSLGLAGFSEAEPFFAAYLDTVVDYRKNTYGFPAEAKAQVSRHWAPFIERWSYAPPA